MKKSLIKLGSANPELRPHIRKVLGHLDKSASHRGPLGEAIEEGFNHLTDMEWDLKEALKDYAWARGFNGEGSREVNALVAKTQKLLQHLDEATALAGDVLSDEIDFVKKHGQPDEYLDRLRRDFFPR